MRPFHKLIAFTPLLALAACATTMSSGPGPSSSLEPIIDPSRASSATPYGLFLAGQAALNDGKSGEAAYLFDQASLAADNPAEIRHRAFTAALLAGEVTRAAALALEDESANEGIKRLGRLVVAVENLAAGRGKQAHEALRSDQIGFPHRSAAALLAPWAAAQAGDLEGASVRPEIRGDRVVEFFGLLGQAHLFERAKRYDEAETDFKALMGERGAGFLFALEYGAFLERRGRRLDAIAVYDEALAERPGDAALRAAKARAQTGAEPPAPPSIRKGAAQSLVAIAAVYAGERQTQLSLVYLRLALRLDAQRDEAWLMLGDILASAGDADAAREAYAQVSTKSLSYAAARGKLAWTYQAAGDRDRALQVMDEAFKRSPDNRDMALNYADLLRASERWEEAIAVLDRVIAADGEAVDWRLLYMRGVALERAGRWPQAERDLLQALKARPDEAELLNYVGYSWIDRGERLTEAMTMVKKAVATNPRSGAMLDSLGWAYYRLGDFKAAVENLERAAELEPADPEVNSHLGDAYWRAGRRIEAEFQWRRVLTLEPGDKLRSETETKLKSGLAAGAPARVAERK